MLAYNEGATGVEPLQDDHLLLREDVAELVLDAFGVGEREVRNFLAHDELGLAALTRLSGGGGGGDAGEHEGGCAQGAQERDV